MAVFSFTCSSSDSHSPVCGSRVPSLACSEEEVLLAVSHPKKRVGRKKFHETRHPVYRGIWRRNSGKWVCEVRVPNKMTRIWLGTFPTTDMVARAHDVVAIVLRDRTACLNFVDSAWRLPLPASSDAKDIQKAAAEAGEAFCPGTESERDGLRLGNEETMTSSAAAVGEEQSTFSIDEEAVPGMLELLRNMADAVLMLPTHESFEDQYDSAEMEVDDAEVSLWSYLI